MKTDKKKMAPRATKIQLAQMMPIYVALLLSCFLLVMSARSSMAFSVGTKITKQKLAFVSPAGGRGLATTRASRSREPWLPLLFAESSSLSSDEAGAADTTVNGLPTSSSSEKDATEPAVDNIQQQRNDLKRQLLVAADNFKAIQKASTSTNATNDAVDEEQDKKKDKDRPYVFPLLRKIMSKIMKKRQKKKKRTVLRSDAFGTAKLEVGEAGNATIALAEQLAKLNPTKVPTYGFKGYGGGSTEDCKLSGRWKLRFTTAADATFSESPKRGSITTSQEIDSKKGTLTNVVDFERGNLKGFRVVVAGKATSDDEIDLTFRRVVILRNSRFLKRIVFPIPARLLRALNRYLSKGKSSPRGPYFQLQYLDDDLRMHKTGEGNWFIQSRLE